MLIGRPKSDKAKLLRHRYVSLPLERLEPRLMLAAEASPLVINLDLGANLDANAPARAALERAAEFWEGVLFDPVVINIDAELTDVGFPNNKTLALTTSTQVRFLYGDVRNRLISDASADEAMVAQLPTPELLRFDLAAGLSINTKPLYPDVVVELTQANALALGFTELPNNVDATITFNSGADFDFDNSNGVDSQSFDFEAVAIHEIAHALGFVSNVDDVDCFASGGGCLDTARIDPMVMDLFRLAPAQGDVFSTAQRILNTGDSVPVQVFHDGQFDVSTNITELEAGDIPLATGVELGDGRQASHLKADDETGVSLGLLAPTFSPGVGSQISETDLRILGLIGWDWHESDRFGEPPNVTVQALITGEAQPELSGTVSEADAQVMVRLPEAFGTNRATLFVDGNPRYIDAFRLTNNAGSPAKILRVEIILPKSGITQQGPPETPHFNTSSATTSGDMSQDFKAVTTMAEGVGLLSPESDDENDTDVADKTKTLTLTFDDFDPGESLAWRIDLDRENRFGPPIDGHDLVGGSVSVFFDDGSVARSTLLDLVGNDDASVAILAAEHIVQAANNGDGTWTLPAGSFDPLAPGTFNVEVTVVDSSGARATDDSGGELIVFPPDVGGLPTVEAVFVDSTQWTGAMRAAATALGVAIPTGAEQSVALPWPGVDRISVRFSQDVVVSADDMTLSGVNGGPIQTADFRYDALAHVATWTLAGPLRVDKLLLELSDAIHDESFKPLDGNWANGASSFPSGNGLIDSDDRFNFRINVLPGDVGGDGAVTRRDLLDVLQRLSVSGESGLYDPRLDLTGDGLIDLDDLRGVVRRLGVTLPSSEPFESGGSPALKAVDAVFDRLGASPAPQNAVIEAPAIGQPALATASTPEENRPPASSDRPRRIRAVHRRAARTATIKPRPLVAPGRFHRDFLRDSSLAARRDQRSPLDDR